MGRLFRLTLGGLRLLPSEIFLALSRGHHLCLIVIAVDPQGLLSGLELRAHVIGAGQFGNGAMGLHAGAAGISRLAATSSAPMIAT